MEAPRDVKEPRDKSSASDTLSPARTDDVTSDLKCNVASKDADLILPTETTINGSDLDDDLKCDSTSSDEREMQNVPPRLTKAIK